MGRIIFFREKGEVSELLQVLANKMSLETLEEEEEEGNQNSSIFTSLLLFINLSDVHTIVDSYIHVYNYFRH